PVGSTPKPSPVNSPQRISPITANPYPLYPSDGPPSGSNAPPLIWLGSVDKLPSLSTIQPFGMDWPRAAASLTLPMATADVAISINNGPVRAEGTALDHGL